MPSGLSSLMLDEMENHPDRVYATFEIDLGDETIKLSNLDVESESSGQYRRRLTWGAFTRPRWDDNFNLVQATGSVQIADQDNSLGKKFGGPYRLAIKDAPCRAHLRSRYVPASNHYKFFDGRVLDWDVSGFQTYGLTLGANDLPLQSRTNSIQPVDGTVWRWAANVIKNNPQPGQVVYGRQKSFGAEGSAGLVQAYPVDTRFGWWYLTAGWPANLLSGGNLHAVYRNGVEETSNWSLRVINSGLVPASGIEDLGGLADMEADTVLVDFDGIEATGLGTDADPITNPIEIIDHALTNFVFNAWPVGATTTGGVADAWLDSSYSPFNATHLAEAIAFYAARDSEASRVIRTTDRGISVLNDFCSSEQAGPFWAWDWKLGIRPIPFANLEIRNGRIVRVENLARSSDGPIPIVAKQKSRALINELTVNWFLDDAAGATRRRGRVIDSNRSPVIGDEITNNWIAGTII